MIPDLEIDKGYEWVAETCMQLWDARRTGKLNQDQLEYELAKISLEFLRDYSWRAIPSKPFELIRFEALKPDEIARLAKSDYEAMKQKAEICKRTWREDAGRADSLNAGNLRWLKRMKELFEQFNNENIHRVQDLILEHESRARGY